MKKLRLYIAVFLAIGLVCVSTAIAANGNNLPYFDNFDDGDALGWNVISGDWFVENGEYHQENPDRNNGETPYGWDQMTTLANIQQSDYFIQADMHLEEANYERGWLGLLFRYQDNQNYYSILLYDNGGEARLEFWTYLNGRWNMVNYENVDVDLYAWNTLSADINGNLFDFYLNGEFIFQSTDDVLVDGDIGLYTEDTRASFDNWVMSGSFENIGDIIAEVEYLLSSGEISNAGVANGLTSTLNSALKALEKGNVNVARNTLLAFISKVTAQANKHISGDGTTILIEAANQILATL